jgi:hypothetical protein
MDYFQGVVTDYLRAKRSRFVNTEYMINLDPDGEQKNRHWYCDAVAIDFEDSTVHLCEITYSKTLQSLMVRLQLWCNHWPELVTALRRDSALKGDWTVTPRLFVPLELKDQLTKRVALVKWPDGCPSPMPQPIITPLEDVLPWRYRSWTGTPYAKGS